MKIFKLFFQLLKANMTQLVVSFVVLIAIMIPLSSIYRSELNVVFEEAEVIYGIVNKDEENDVTEHFLAYLEENADVLYLEDDAEVIADSLFLSDVDYIVEIPQGFGAGLLAGGDEIIPLESTKGDMSSAAYAEVLLSEYMRNFEVLAAGVNDLNDDSERAEFFDNLESTFANTIDVNTQSSSIDGDLISFGNYYTHYVAYVLIMGLISSFGIASIAMRKPEIEMRNRMSYMTESTRSMQLLLANLTFAIVYWLIFMIAAAFMFGISTLFSYHGLLIILSSFISLLSITAMSYFFVTIANSKGMIYFLSNFVSLFLAFISGIFMPRAFINDFLQNIASFAAPVWQVRADELILSVEVLNNAQVNQLLQYFGIELLIMAAYLAAGFVVNKYRQVNNVYNK